MKKQFLRVMSLLLTVGLLLTAAPLSGQTDRSAGTAGNSSLGLSAKANPNVPSNNKSCGEGLSWIINDTGTLTIRGNGPMNDCKHSLWWHNVKNVVIEEGVTYIGNGTFSDCVSLKSLSLPSSVTKINEYAFLGYDGDDRGNTALETITVAAGNPVYHSTNNCLIETATKKMILGSGNSVIPDDGSVTKIGWASFIQNKALQSITIPDCVTAIESGSFKGCSSLKSITIGSGVSKIDNTAFQECGSLESITVSKDNTVFSSKGNCLIEKYSSSSFLKLGCKNSVIPDDGSITIIYSSAFSGCAGLKEITIPEGITAISAEAFLNCTGLEHVTLPESLRTIGNSAFSGCTALRDFTVPDGVTNFSLSALNDCTGLESLTIGKGATNDFYAGLTNCASLKKIEISPDNPVYHSDGNCVIKTDTKELVNGCTASVIPSDGSVTKIGDSAFKGVNGLISITVPNGVETIGSNAFAECAGLKSVTITDSVTEMGHSAFNRCTALTDITLSKNLKAIDTSMFSKCSSLMAITIPEGVESIGDDAFFECTSLREVTLPEGLKSIGERAFYPCHFLSDIVIPESVTSIGEIAFAECTNLNDLVLSNNITQIGRNAFRGCTGLFLCYKDSAAHRYFASEEGLCYALLDGTKEENTISGVIAADKTPTGNEIKWSIDKLTRTLTVSCDGPCELTNKTEIPWVAYSLYIHFIKLPDTLTKFNGSAFSRCDNLEKIVIPQSVEAITSTNPFSSCEKLKEITVEKENNWFASEDGVLFNKDKTKLISYPQGKEDTVYTVPDSVKIIGGFSFMISHNNDNDPLYDVILPEGLTEIGMNAFAYRAVLSKIIIPASVSTIGENAFNETGKKAEKFVLTVSENNQHFCVVDNILFSKDKTVLIRYPYESKTTKYTVPDGVSQIEKSAFYGCENLRFIILADTVSAIGEQAFFSCRHLNSITIPRSVVTAGKNMLSGCYYLQEICYTGTQEQWNSVFASVILPENAVVYYGDAVTDPHEHSFGAWVVTKAATADTEGEEACACIICGEKKTRTTDKLTPQQQEPDYRLGDIDGNGKIESADARLALRASVSLEQYDPGSAQFLAADVDKSGAIESSDARKILRVSVNLDTF